jgi:hypothetical protein
MAGGTGILAAAAVRVYRSRQRYIRAADALQRQWLSAGRTAVVTVTIDFEGKRNLVLAKRSKLYYNTKKIYYKGKKFWLPRPTKAGQPK